MCTANADDDDSDDEAAGAEYEARGARKKDKKRQEREAQRQVQWRLSNIVVHLPVLVTESSFCHLWCLRSCCNDLFLQAEQAARDTRGSKQDYYTEARRRKEEAREAEEQRLVCLLPLTY